MTASFVGRIFTTPRVGQNAVLSALRAEIPGAAEYGAHSPSDGRIVYSLNRLDSAMIRDGIGGVYVDDDPQMGRPVWLSRRDQTAQAISWAIAAQSGQYREPATPVTYRRADVQVALDTIVDQEIRWQQLLGGQPHLRLWYEDHVEHDPTVAAQLILDWWSIDGTPGPAQTERFDADIKADWRLRWDTGVDY
jgi:LPS sulfotransferase NodH